MSAERVLQILIATMSVLAATLMGIGQHSVLMPVAMLVAAVASVIFTDHLGWLVLHRAVVNVVAIGAMAITLMDFWDTDSTGQLMEIAFLLVCWQVVMLFQGKGPRVYWCLAVLSLLQVVVASVLNVGVQFGILLALYVAVGMFALAVFFVHREVLRARLDRDLFEGSSEPALPRPASRAMLHRRNTAISLSPEPPAPGILGAVPCARQAISPDAVQQQLLTGPFLRHISGLCVLTLIFAAAFFYAAPRLGGPKWNGVPWRPQREVGFTREIDLNEIGRIQQSNELVMRVSFFERNVNPATQTRPIYKIFGKAYFQGTTLTDYVTSNQGDSRWKQITGFRTKGGVRLPRAPSRRTDIVRQEFLLEPVTERTLFSVFPVWRLRGTPNEIRQDRYSGQIFRAKETDALFEGQQYRYVVGTSGFLAGLQTPMSPHNTFDQRDGRLDSFTRRRLLDIDPERFPVLIKTAERVVSEANAKNNPLLLARMLQNHLLNTDIYTYTLDFSDRENQPRSQMDPIEEFVAKTRTGHCEYFASALVMMLRSQGIPARLVVGYVASDFNTLGNYYQVRQSDAHAWVEAYLEPESVPKGTQTSNIPPGFGAWVRLDPTPGDTDQFEVQTAGILKRVDQVLDYAQVLWNQYVMEMSPEQQQRVLYDPLNKRAMLGMAGLERLRAVPRTVDRVARTAMANVQSLVRGTFSAAGLISLLGLLAVMGGLIWLLRRLGLWILARLHDRALHAKTAAGSQVLFFRQLERLLRRAGLIRRPGQTQREFAESVRQRLAGNSSTASVANIPCEFADLFYRVRFGGHSLDREEVESVEHSLSQLDLALRNQRRGGSPQLPPATPAST